MSLPMAQQLLVLRFNLGMDIDIPSAPSVTPPKLNAAHPATIQPWVPLACTAASPHVFQPGLQSSRPDYGYPAVNYTTIKHATKAYNLGFSLPMAVTLPASNSAQVLAQETSMNVGYGINNILFWFECELPSPIGEWQPELIQVLQPLLPATSLPVALPPVALPSFASSLSAASLVPAIADAVPGPSHATIDIVHCLGGQEFDHPAQIIVSSALGPGDDVQDPKPDEVLETNRVMLMAFLESRDWLTRVFKDHISLHHLAQVHEQVLPSLESLLIEVDQAEAQSGTDESGNEI
ncbi:hypothetical protein BDR04DRAFT_1160142 [Suillus decipiens]|nr:hypothetical protein BDR04DRAFT_1160142 [Suillus decipiens]